MKYVPGPVPFTFEGVKAYLTGELRRIADELSPNVIQLPVLGVAPARPVNGMIAYADGASWNPGAGQGFYGFQAGTWVKL